MTDETFLDFELHIAPSREHGYPAHIRLGGGGDFDGMLPADIADWISTGDRAADGRRLFDALFTDPDLRRAWERACGQATQRRIRFWIDADAPELHALPWELLHDGKSWLAATGTTPFSRYLQSDVDWIAPVTARPIRVLAAVANPDNLARYRLAALDVAQECALLEEACAPSPSAPIPVDLKFLDPPVTLERLKQALQKGEGYHVLHIVSHGIFSQRRDQAALYLQDSEGHTQVVPDDDLVAMLTRQAVRPHLVFLAACQSAQPSSSTGRAAAAFGGLGPKLVVDAEIPAVVAMQHQVAIMTTRKLTSAFYAHLLRHGAVDRALNAARSLLFTAHAPDAAVPVLFMRLKDGRLFQTAADVLQVIEQRYPLLRDYVYDVTTTIETVTQWFIGRDFVFDWLEEQLDTLPCGYLRLVADAGLGKTAIAAEVTRRYGALAHFVNASQGVTRPSQCLNALCVQLIARYDLPYDHLPGRAGMDANFMQTVLREVVDKGGENPVLLVIDALDEADPVSAGRNWLYLPDHLPEGVYVLLTHRPGEYPIVADARTPQPEPLIIAWNDVRQQADIADHLWRQAERPEIHQALETATPPIAMEQFVSALQTAAEGNFKYLDYVLADIANREPGFDPLEVQGLPRGLQGYYAHFWAQMRPSINAPEVEWDAWETRHLFILEALGVAGEPVTADWLVDHTGIRKRTVRRILRKWQRFLRCEQRGEGDRDSVRTWRIIHQSFADFLAEKVDLPAAHRRAAKYYLDTWGSWDVGLPHLDTASELHNGYGLRHLAMHLSEAAWWEPLHALFATDTWLQVRVAADNYTYDGYLTDLVYVWRYAYKEVIREIEGNRSPYALIDCVHYALVRTTLNSLSINYPPELLVRAVELGVWSPARAVSLAQQIPEPEQQVKSFHALLSLSSMVLSTEIRRECGNLAMDIIKNIDDIYKRSDLLIMLTPHIPSSLYPEALEIACTIWKGYKRKEVLRVLFTHLPTNVDLTIASPIIDAAISLQSSYPDQEIFSTLASRLSPSLWLKIL